MPWPYDPSTPILLPEEEYRLLREYIRSRLGLYFGPARRDILATRLQKRLRALSFRSYLEYYHYLLYAKKPVRQKELTALVQTLANGETYFFREAYQFDLLYQDTIWNQVTAPLPRKTRILSLGCSTGEELYSLAILGIEQQKVIANQVEFLGVDLNAKSIVGAKQGLYRPYSFRTSFPYSKEKYFIPAGKNSYAIRPWLKNMVQFSQGNLLQFKELEPIEPVDALFCRNVLIYFDDLSIARAAKIFHQTLRTGGILFLGHSETFLGKGFPFEAIRIGQHIVYKSL